MAIFSPSSLAWVMISFTPSLSVIASRRRSRRARRVSWTASRSRCLPMRRSSSSMGSRSSVVPMDNDHSSRVTSAPCSAKVSSVVLVGAEDEGVEALDGARDDAQPNPIFEWLEPDSLAAHVPRTFEHYVEAPWVETNAGLCFVEVSMNGHPMGMSANACCNSPTEHHVAKLARDGAVTSPRCRSARADRSASPDSRPPPGDCDGAGPLSVSGLTQR
jgi:hypothetical protein